MTVFSIFIWSLKIWGSRSSPIKAWIGIWRRGKGQHFEYPSDTHDQHQFEVHQAPEPENLQSVSADSSVLHPEFPKSQTQVDKIHD